MDYSKGELDPAELTPIEERLRAERVTPTPVELDALKLRAMRQAAPAAPRFRKGVWMKSRLALTLMIVLGLMMSTTGAGLAISGSSDRGSAAEGQYGGKEDKGGPDNLAGTVQGGTQGGSDNAGSGPTTESQPTEQVAVATDDGGSLPFTGFVTIPLIVGGVALLSGGALLRWRARDQRE
jgi:hypothetical protein